MSSDITYIVTVDIVIHNEKSVCQTIQNIHP